MARAVKCLKDHEDELHKVGFSSRSIWPELMTAG